jgi:hypothetical protein
VNKPLFLDWHVKNTAHPFLPPCAHEHAQLARYLLPCLPPGADFLWSCFLTLYARMPAMSRFLTCTMRMVSLSVQYPWHRNLSAIAGGLSCAGASDTPILANRHHCPDHLHNHCRTPRIDLERQEPHSGNRLPAPHCPRQPITHSMQQNYITWYRGFFHTCRVSPSNMHRIISTEYGMLCYAMLWYGMLWNKKRYTVVRHQHPIFLAAQVAHQHAGTGT